VNLVGGPRDGAEVSLPAERDAVFVVPVLKPPTVIPDGFVVEPGYETAEYSVGMDDRGQPVGRFVPGSHVPRWW
jgi:hypothetical protein